MEQNNNTQPVKQQLAQFYKYTIKKKLEKQRHYLANLKGVVFKENGT